MYDDGAHLDEKRGDGIYGGEIAPFSGGTVVLYYVEARSATSSAATVFEPAATEWGAHSYNVAFKHAESTPVVINELMALNTSSLLDPQGGYDDWIELHNSSDAPVDIAGMYLSDKEDNPRKWAFPKGTIIAPRGYIIVWADEDEGDQPGLHANFRLSRDGETLLLVDADERGNRVLDSIEFGAQAPNVSLGRFPDGTGDFRSLIMTPGMRNDS
jgi:hypothetical protein